MAEEGVAAGTDDRLGSGVVGILQFRFKWGIASLIF